jgi:AraC-like DNA-binding protein
LFERIVVVDGKDVTPQFSLDEIDHHEFLDVLTSRYTTSWHVGKDAITFPASPDYKIKLRISHGEVERVFAGKALIDAELGELLGQVEADLKDARIAEYGVDILFAHQPVIGGFRFGALHEWINSHLGDDLSLSVLADRAGMSERSFSRHYAEATRQTPARAIERLRVEAARRLLSESRLPVKRVAERCGFGSEETMRRSFLRLLAVTPQDYRSRFTF